MELAVPPYGQQRPVGKNSLQKFAVWKPQPGDKHSLWPPSIVSFEAWCAYTYYDHTKDDGGPHFQKLAHYMLVGNSNGTPTARSGEEKKVPGLVNGLSDKYISGYGKTPWQRGDLSVKEKENGVEVIKQAHLGQVAGKYPHMGGPSTYVTVNKSRQTASPPFEQTFTDQQWWSSLATVSAKPGTKNSFMFHLGLDVYARKDKGPCSAISNNVRTFATLSKRTDRDSEVLGCASLGNRLAAFFGLYHYPGCTTDAVNWTQDVTVEYKGKDTQFSVRMRLPNPNYEFEGGVSGPQLVCYEPLQKKAEEFDEASGIVAGGFPVPRLRTPKSPVLHEDNYGEWYTDITTNEQSFRARIAPFFGVQKEQPVTRALSRAMAAAFPGRYIAPEATPGHLGGFAPPSAIWLWPHGPTEGVKLGAVKYGKQAKDAGLPLASQYQRQPEWRVTPTQAAVAQAASNISELNSWKGAKQASLLKPFVVKKPLVRRAYVLGLEKNPERVKRVEELKAGEEDAEEEEDDAEDEEAPAPAPALQALQATRQKKAKTPAKQAPPPTDANVGVEADAARKEAPQEQDGDDPDDDTLQPQDKAADPVIEYAPQAFETGEAASLAAALTWTGESTNELLLEERALAASAGAAQALDNAAGKTALGDQVLPPGSRRRVRDNKLNAHWYSANYQPWPTRDLYSENKAEFEHKEVMDQAAVDKYKKDYGNVSNLFIRSQKLPKKLTGVEVKFGEALRGTTGKLLLDCRLTAFQKEDDDHKELDTAGIETFKRNMQRIVYVYHDTSGNLSTKLTTALKKKGMENGIWCFKQKGQKQVPLMEPRYEKPDGRKGEQEQRLPAVFNTACHTDLRDKTRCAVYDTDLFGGGTPVPDCDDDLLWVKSDMTVREWLQTPWHYQYLPYQPETSNFRDGETYCEGCNRCARPFFEFPNRYEHYWKSEKGTAHWPLKYWKFATQDVCEAPLPFNDERFWSGPQKAVVAQVGGFKPIPSPATSSEVNKKEEDAGYHNWQTFGFQLRDQVLAGERQLLKQRLDRSRTEGAVALNRTLADARIPFTFRKVINHAYDSERADVYKPIVQGKLTTDAALVRHGMKNYYLTRATKYGNVCKDCAAVLELAPGLYHKNTRTAASYSILREARHRDNKHNWWANLAALKVDGEEFDVDFIKTFKGKSDPVKFDKHMKVAQDYLFSRHCNIPTVTTDDGTVAQVTKLSGPADIYVQKRWDKPREGKAERWAKLESETIREAKDFFESLKSQIAANYVRVQGKTTREGVVTVAPQPALPLKLPAVSNMALYDLMHDVHNTMVSRHVYRQDPNAHIKKFDPDMVRIETRNFKATKGGKTYYNCLKVRTWQPTDVKKSKAKDADDNEYETGNTQLTRRAREDYKEVIYYANRKGEHGEDSETLGQWRGDAYVLNYENGKWVEPSRAPRKGWAVEQVRSMKQSRVFITYSLHRPVTSELEARLVMERMADAVRCLFSNDRYLCELLIFGQKLQTVENNAKLDTISQKQYVPITTTKKAGTIFYGSKEGGGSSYLHDTYETHIDSVSVDAGIEIGPTLHHPHFHLLLTLNHFSYVQLDYYKMKALLEQMFKGLKVGDNDFSHNDFYLQDAGGMPFYTDNENPYVDFRLYPTDNWQDVIAAYVRKNANPGIFESLRTRTGT